MTKINTILIFFILISFNTLSQSYSVNPKAQKNFNKALINYSEYKYDKAITYLEDAIGEDDKFAEAYKLLGNIYLKRGNLKLAIGNLKKAIEIDPEKNYVSSGKLCKYFYESLNFEESEYYGKLFLDNITRDRYRGDLLGEVDQILQNIPFAKEAIKTPVNIELINLGSAINSEFDEYFPTLTVDNKMILFTRRVINTELINDRNKNGFQEDFYLSIKDENDKWKNAISLGTNINKDKFNEGAGTLSTDGNMLIFTACETLYGYPNDRDGYGSCDLYYSFRMSENSWSSPKNMGPNINSGNWETQPSFSSNGRTLYFVRGVRTNKGRMLDIYTSELLDDMTWSVPVKLPETINSKGREQSVFIHPDNQTLYFSSDGFPGMGGLDVFMARKDEDGEWQQAINLGYPINTFENENSILVSPNGSLAYIASDRVGTFGGLDLYTFKLPDHLKPNKVFYFKGIIYDKYTKTKLGAQCELFNIDNQLSIANIQSNNYTGEFLITLPSINDFGLTIIKKGYLPYSEQIKVNELDSSKNHYYKEIFLTPIKIGASFILKNIYFDSGKYELKEASFIELDKLVMFLKENKGLKIEIQGHTDDVGTEIDNLKLSNLRAKEVSLYIEQSRIAKSRLIFKGYGENSPLVPNTDSLNRQENRRIEFKIIK